MEAEKYILEFEAEGLKPLFQELMIKNYYPDGSVMTFKDNVLKSLIKSDVWTSMGEEGIKMYGDSSAITFNDAKQNIEECADSLKSYTNKAILAPEEIREVYSTFEKAASSYGIFNVAYAEKAFEEAKNNKIISDNLRKVELIKNNLKNEFSQIFFSGNSPWRKLIDIIANQFNIDKDLIEWYRFEEIVNLFLANLVSEEEINCRKNSYVFEINGHSVNFYSGSKADEFIKKQNFSDIKPVDTIRGLVANRGGKVTGSVKIINVDYANFDQTKKKIEEMTAGQVLVSRTTDPSMTAACKKAVAIITDVGGTLSHAAIISRELKIPCIVGTNTATKVLKDGDMVEVDAEKGVVRKI